MKKTLDECTPEYMSRLNYPGMALFILAHAERFRVAYEKDDAAGGYWTWDEDYATYDEAREAAESTVDDQDANRATITSRLSDICDEYDGDIWEVNHD